MPSLKQRLLEVLLSDDDEQPLDEVAGSNERQAPATDGAPSVIGESEVAPPAESSAKQEPAKQDEDVAAQLKAMQEQINTLQTENKALKATRLPTPSNALSSTSEPDVDRMTIDERVKYYYDVVQPQQAKEAELSARVR